MSDTWPKCWGRNTEIFHNDTVSVNFLELVKGGVCSWHFHRHKHNIFSLVSGKVLIKTEHNEIPLEPGNSILVQSPMKHQFEALEDSKMIEVMFVQYMSEDIIRETQGFLKKQDDEVPEPVPPPVTEHSEADVSDEVPEPLPPQSDVGRY